MQQIERTPLFDLGQLVATPGALAGLEKAGRTRWSFYRAMFGAIGANCLKRTKTRTSSACTKVYVFSAATAPLRATKSGSSPKPTAPTPTEG